MVHCTAGVALVASTLTLCGRRGACDTGLAHGGALGRCDASVLWVASVALGGIDGHLVRSTLTLCAGRGTYGTGRRPLRGGRGTWGHRRPLCVAGVTLGEIDAHFVWQVWHETLTLCVAG